LHDLELCGPYDDGATAQNPYLAVLRRACADED
jgi:hypothetical protein